MSLSEKPFSGQTELLPQPERHFKNNEDIINKPFKSTKFFNFHSDIFDGIWFFASSLIIIIAIIESTYLHIYKMLFGKKMKIDFWFLLWFLVFLYFGFFLMRIGWQQYKKSNLWHYLQNMANVNRIFQDYQSIKTKQVQLILEVKNYNRGYSGKILLKFIRKNIPLTSVLDESGILQQMNLAKTFTKRYIFIDYELTYQFPETNPQQKQRLDQLFRQHVRNNKSGDYSYSKKRFQFLNMKDNVIRKGYLKEGNESKLGKYFDVLNKIFIVWLAAIGLEFFVQRWTINIKKIITINQNQQL